MVVSFPTNQVWARGAASSSRGYTQICVQQATVSASDSKVLRMLWTCGSLFLGKPPNGTPHNSPSSNFQQEAQHGPRTGANGVAVGCSLTYGVHEGLQDTMQVDGKVELGHSPLING
ncbi:hypothetical protein DL546_004357 [Coniochaeta pulveracea]|uniref:Uncharacterized protein n=1 Tax=Coniochaeta pulveracea TaxID=177199 RepID=A0A420YI43_9PEZI|nr:hypothetical protein DL546_004357 [Coniochaeta pulveracea]